MLGCLKLLGFICKVNYMFIVYDLICKYLNYLLIMYDERKKMNEFDFIRLLVFIYKK